MIPQKRYRLTVTAGDMVTHMITFPAPTLEYLLSGGDPDRWYKMHAARWLRTINTRRWAPGDDELSAEYV